VNVGALMYVTASVGASTGASVGASIRVTASVGASIRPFKVGKDYFMVIFNNHIQELSFINS